MARIQELPLVMQDYLRLMTEMDGLRKALKDRRGQLKLLELQLQPHLTHLPDRKQELQIEEQHCDIYGNCKEIKLRPFKEQCTLGKKKLPKILFKYFETRFQGDAVKAYADECYKFIISMITKEQKNLRVIAVYPPDENLKKRKKEDEKNNIEDDDDEEDE